MDANQTKTQKKYVSTLLGLENELNKKIFWVEDEYRKNDLSLVDGGVDVIVDHFNKKYALGYDKVKNIRMYIKQIKNLDQLNSIFVKVYKTDKERNVSFFIKIWDGSFLKNISNV